MLPKIHELVLQMNDDQIRYCHWKSNWFLEETVAGETDLDLLIHRRDAGRFRTILRTLGFEPSIEAGTDPFPAVEHYHALDETGQIAHVHAYYRVVSGESLAKNYRLPVEDMLLEDTQRIGIVAVPRTGAELIIFVLRMLLKHTTPIELALFLRDQDSFRQEVDWLMTASALDEARALLPAWLPRIDDALFVAGFRALQEPAPIWKRVVLGHRVRFRLRRLARRHPLRARFVELRKFTTAARYRLSGTKKKLTPGGGGSVIAFVGSEATGKSTLIAEIECWLGQHYTVRRIHAGKPPSTPSTALPHVLLPMLRQLMPEQRSTVVDAEYHRGNGGPQGYGLAFAVRSVMLAHERRALLSRAFSRAANGAIVLTDRYPSKGAGAPDGPQLAHFPTAADPIRRWLCASEARMYRDIPEPDLVVHLTAPLNVTLERNASREKVENEDYVRLRHSLTENLDFGDVPVFKVDTDRPLDDVVSDTKAAIWDAL